MNCYSTFTLDDSIPCSEEDAKELIRLLQTAECDVDDDLPHGIDGEYHDGSVYLYSDGEFADPEMLPTVVRKKIGEILTKANLHYVGFGVAFTADRPKPGSHGGNDGRIYADGVVEMAHKSFAHE